MSYDNLVAVFNGHKNLTIVPRPRDNLPKSIKGGASWGHCFPQHDCARPTYFIVHGECTYAVTGVDSDTLDLLAKSILIQDLAAKRPTRLFLFAWQWLIDGTGTILPVGQLFLPRKGTENA